MIIQDRYLGDGNGKQSLHLQHAPQLAVDQQLVLLVSSRLALSVNSKAMPQVPMQLRQHKLQQPELSKVPAA